jgi:HEPN domain-containing protein
MARAVSVGCARHAEEWRGYADRELNTAQELRATGKDWPNVYWHAGFSVECLLKAVRVKREGLESWPNGDTGGRWHDINYAAERAGLTAELQAMRRHDRAFGAYWLTVKDWRQDRRYPGNSVTEREARDLLTAVANPTDGVRKWLLQVYHQL